jgi:hypothetical protein
VFVLERFVDLVLANETGDGRTARDGDSDGSSE